MGKRRPEAGKLIQENSDATQKEAARRKTRLAGSSTRGSTDRPN
jgi:hypothetical protein